MWLFWFAYSIIVSTYIISNQFSIIINIVSIGLVELSSQFCWVQRHEMMMDPVLLLHRLWLHNTLVIICSLLQRCRITYHGFTDSQLGTAINIADCQVRMFWFREWLLPGFTKYFLNAWTALPTENIDILNCYVTCEEAVRYWIWNSIFEWFW